MENNDPVWIGVAQTGVTVKKSKMGLFGSKLFASRDLIHAAGVSYQLGQQLSDTMLPEGCEITNPVLEVFVKACIASSTLLEFCSMLAKADELSSNSSES